MITALAAQMVECPAQLSGWPLATVLVFGIVGLVAFFYILMH